MAEDKLGNDGADGMATAAVDAHAAPEALLQRARQRKAWAQATDRMMLRILRERREAEAALVREGHVMASFPSEADHG